MTASLRSAPSKFAPSKDDPKDAQNFFIEALRKSAPLADTLRNSADSRSAPAKSTPSSLTSKKVALNSFVRGNRSG